MEKLSDSFVDYRVNPRLSVLKNPRGAYVICTEKNKYFYDDKMCLTAVLSKINPSPLIEYHYSNGELVKSSETGGFWAYRLRYFRQENKDNIPVLTKYIITYNTTEEYFSDKIPVCFVGAVTENNGWQEQLDLVLQTTVLSWPYDVREEMVPNGTLLGFILWESRVKDNPVTEPPSDNRTFVQKITWKLARFISSWINPLVFSE